MIPPCLPLAGPPQGRVGRDGQTNEGLVPVSPEDPFVGELRCIAMDESLAPTSRNDLIGEALIGKKVGDRAEVQLPRGQLNIEILSFE